MNAEAARVARLVVGDDYEQFARAVNALTIADATDATAAGEFTAADRLLLGQGLSATSLRRLRAAVDEADPECRPALTGGVEPVDSALSHKCDPSNILLADLMTTGPREVSATLRLDAANEFVLDHQTGLHVQGMVVVEFARQLVLAACGTLGLFTRFDDPRFVINSMSTQFDGFLFPVPARGDLVISELEYGRGASARVTAEVAVMQAGLRAVGVVFEAGVFEADRIRAIEASKALEIASRLRGGRVDA